MEISTTITLGNILTVAAFIVAIAGWVYIQRSRIDVQDQRLREMELKCAELHTLANATKEDLMAYKLHVTTNYVQHPNMEKVEQRLLAAIDRLTTEITALRAEFRRVLTDHSGS